MNATSTECPHCHEVIDINQTTMDAAGQCECPKCHATFKPQASQPADQSATPLPQA